MHEADGSNYENESVLLELDAPSKVVIQHESLPRYVLTIRLAAEEGATRIVWNQQFGNPVAAARLRHIVEPAN